MRPVDHIARGTIVPLPRYVRRLRARAADAAWSGDHATAARLEAEAEAATTVGDDPVPMF